MKMWMVDGLRLLDGNCLDGIERREERKQAQTSCDCKIVVIPQAPLWQRSSFPVPHHSAWSKLDAQTGSCRIRALQSLGRFLSS